MPRAPKACGHPGCAARVVGRTYCREHDRVHRWGRESHRVVPADWARRKATVMARDHGVCHVCGHGGATDCDHVVNVAAGGTHDLGNLALIHAERCPTCGKRCHKDKTQDEAQAGRAVQRAKLRHPVEQHPGLR